MSRPPDMRLLPGEETPRQHLGARTQRELVMVGEWPLRSFLELGALPSAVPCARYHCRQVLWEWRLTGLAHSAELLVSDSLVTNAITASRSAGSDSPVRLWLLSDAAQVLIVVWDASPLLPARADVSAEAEAGRGLLLVEMISDQWGTCATPPCGKRSGRSR
jgi:hypothetical protein